MAYFKLNRLHLHLVDGGGWRLEIKKYPQLIKEGAYRTHSDWDEWIENGRRFCRKEIEGAYGGYYTQKEMKDLIAYAQKRHITIIPEIEMPGHSNEVLHTFPQLSCTGKGDGFDLCVGNPETYNFLTDVLKEVIDLFPSEHIHIGGDEATMLYWKKCPKCLKLLNDNNFTDTIQIQSYLISRIDSFLYKNNRKLIGWDEILDSTKLSPTAVVMSWRGERGGISAAKAGHNTIISPSRYYYLDHFQASPDIEPKAIAGFSPLERVYYYNPIPTEIRHTPAEKYIEGIQGNLWTEYIGIEEYGLSRNLVGVSINSSKSV